MKVPDWKKIKSKKDWHQWEHEEQDITVSVKHIERAFWAIQVNGEQFNWRKNFKKARQYAINSMRSTRLLYPTWRE